MVVPVVSFSAPPCWQAAATIANRTATRASFFFRIRFPPCFGGAVLLAHNNV